MSTLAQQTRRLSDTHSTVEIRIAHCALLASARAASQRSTSLRRQTLRRSPRKIGGGNLPARTHRQSVLCETGISCRNWRSRTTEMLLFETLENGLFIPATVRTITNLCRETEIEFFQQEGFRRPLIRD